MRIPIRVTTVLLVVSSAFCAGCASPAKQDVDTTPTHFYFAQFSDAHIGEADHAERLESVIRELNGFPSNLVCVVATGDLFANSIEDETERNQLLELIAAIEAPFLAAPGNHDVLEDNPSATEALFEKYINPCFYSAEYNGVVFIVTHFHPVLHGYTDADVDPLQWTRQALKNSGGKPVIILHHVPCAPTDYYLGAFHDSEWSEDLSDAWETLLNTYNVKAVLTGHFHRDELHWLGRVPVYTCPSVAGYWGRQAAYRIYEYNDGLLDYTTQHVEPVPAARGFFAGAEASTQGEQNSAVAAVDDNRNTRWESAHQTDPQWLTVELKEPRIVERVRIRWETAAAEKYDVLLSEDGEHWTLAAEVADGLPGEDRTVTCDPAPARFVKVLGHSRATQWGYSIWEIEVH